MLKRYDCYGERSVKRSDFLWNGRPVAKRSRILLVSTNRRYCCGFDSSAPSLTPSSTLKMASRTAEILVAIVCACVRFQLFREDTSEWCYMLFCIVKNCEVGRFICVLLTLCVAYPRDRNRRRK